MHQDLLLPDPVAVVPLHLAIVDHFLMAEKTITLDRIAVPAGGK